LTVAVFRDAQAVRVDHAVLSQLVVEAVTRVSAELVATIGGDAPDPGPRSVPRDLRLWLARLRLLEGVPFGYLVADASLLPPESIRFFHVDRGWTDALVEGALSVGTVTTADRGMLENLYGTVRAEEGRMPGTLAREPKGTNGFGYDPILVVEGDTRHSAELSPEEKNAISHRGKAFRALVPHLRELLR
jgi:hypothetical protein